MRAVLILLFLVCLSVSADAATMRAPSFTFTGVYTVTFDTNVRATLRLDTGQVASGTGTQFSLNVPDGIHTFTVNVTNPDGTRQNLQGTFTGQDLSPLIARQVQAAVEASQASQAAAEQARTAALLARDESVDVLNATLDVQVAVHDAKNALAALGAELELQGKAQREASVQLALEQQALAARLVQAYENQTRALEAAHRGLVTLQHTVEALLLLLVAGIACLAVFLHSIRRRGIQDGAVLREVALHLPRDAPTPSVDARRRRPARARPEPEPPSLDALLGLPPDGGGRDEP
jgi:hypothetical protein